MKLQKLLSYTRQAVDDYHMIEEGDKIGVALSGGKDSISLLMGMKALQRFYPKKFEIIAISINPGFDFFDTIFLVVIVYLFTKIYYKKIHRMGLCS